MKKPHLRLFHFDRYISGIFGNYLQTRAESKAVSLGHEIRRKDTQSHPSRLE